jgi:hypothetical protein
LQLFLHCAIAKVHRERTVFNDVSMSKDVGIGCQIKVGVQNSRARRTGSRRFAHSVFRLAFYSCGVAARLFRELLLVWLRTVAFL